jgi:hypothetical protein
MISELPLAGLNIVVTRPREQAAGLVHRIEQLGGKPLLFPLLEIAAVSDDRALREQTSRLNKPTSPSSSVPMQCDMAWKQFAPPVICLHP